MRSRRTLLPSRVRGTHGALAILLGLIAVFSMSVLTGWHEMHPDVHFPETVAAQSHADHPGEDSGSNLDHLAAHAGLHGIGLPADTTMANAPLIVAAQWHLAADRFALRQPATSILRPPRA